MVSVDPPSEYPRGTPRRGRDPPSTTARLRYPALAWWIVMSTACNYALMMWLVKQSSPTFVASSSALQPPLTALAAQTVIWATRGAAACRAGGPERCVAAPTAADLVAGALVIGGLLLVARSERSAAAARAAYERVEAADADEPAGLALPKSPPPSPQRVRGRAGSVD